ncbi:MAG: hypothetical protein ABI847_06805 [Anaerolineales bacterium]
MRRFLLFLLSLTVACGLLPRARLTPTVPPTAALTATRLPPTSAPSATLSPTYTPTHTPTHPPTASPPPAAGADQLTPADVIFHPDPQLYSGDIVSLEVLAPATGPAWDGAQAKIYLDQASGAPLAQNNFARYGLASRLQATFTWVWDTHGREGRQTIIVEAQPNAVNGVAAARQTLTLSVDLLPAVERPEPEPEAEWATAESDCCVFHYLTHTAAARDLDTIRAQADAAFVHIEQVLGVQRQQKVVFTLASKLIGHGGFASGEVTLSYLDRNPAASDLFTLFSHEGTHILDRQISNTRPTIMTEGLAVFVAGGHFKAEPLQQRAAGLLALNRYLPLRALADGVYTAQHEIGYLEGGGFIQYLVERFGWDRFRAMYAAFQNAPSDSQMLDAGLQAQYGEGLDALEAEWLDSLAELPPDPAQTDDLRLTVELYDSIRRYQHDLDPSDYFLTAWLPGGQTARERGITADFIRRPAAPENLALETLLVAAADALRAQNYHDASALLAGVNAALDAHSLAASPLAADQLGVVNQVLEAGYEPQRITLSGVEARVSAIRQWPRLEPLLLQRGAGGWQILASGADRGLFDGIIGAWAARLWPSQLD